MQAGRLLSILMLLQARTRVSAPALARALEVSERTILRDIDRLSAAGIPVWGERGRHGGFQLSEGWSTKLTGLSEAEARALLLAGLPGPAAELGLGAAAASAGLKMVASLPAEWRGQAQRVATRLHVDMLDWYRTRESPGPLHAVAEAVWTERSLRIRYESWQRIVQREVDPLGLVLKAGTWYFVARASRGDRIATYRLANVLDLAPLHTFTRPRAFDLAACWTASAAAFESGLRRIEACVRVSPRGMKWLANLRLPVDTLPSDDAVDAAGWTRLSIGIESLEHGARQLLALGGEMEVLSPAGLRERVATLAGQVSATHSASAPATAATRVRRR